MPSICIWPLLTLQAYLINQLFYVVLLSIQCFLLHKPMYLQNRPTVRTVDGTLNKKILQYCTFLTVCIYVQFYLYSILQFVRPKESYLPNSANYNVGLLIVHTVQYCTVYSSSVSKLYILSFLAYSLVVLIIQIQLLCVLYLNVGLIKDRKDIHIAHLLQLLYGCLRPANDSVFS